MFYFSLSENMSRDAEIVLDWVKSIFLTLSELGFQRTNPSYQWYKFLSDFHKSH